MCSIQFVSNAINRLSEQLRERCMHTMSDSWQDILYNFQSSWFVSRWQYEKAKTSINDHALLTWINQMFVIWMRATSFKMSHDWLARGLLWLVDRSGCLETRVRNIRVRTMWVLKMLTQDNVSTENAGTDNAGTVKRHGICEYGKCEY